eukprot:105160-Pelagomonas_calceolata.AAC.1
MSIHVEVMQTTMPEKHQTSGKPLYACVLTHNLWNREFNSSHCKLGLFDFRSHSGQKHASTRAAGLIAAWNCLQCCPQKGSP